jgi:hypothetical protein
MTNTLTVEIEGEDKPALVADWITRLVFALSRPPPRSCVL